MMFRNVIGPKVNRRKFRLAISHWQNGERDSRKQRIMQSGRESIDLELGNGLISKFITLSNSKTGALSNSKIVGGHSTKSVNEVERLGIGGIRMYADSGACLHRWRNVVVGHNKFIKIKIDLLVSQVDALFLTRRLQ